MRTIEERLPARGRNDGTRACYRLRPSRLAPADFDTRWATYTEEFRAPRLPALLVAMMGNLVVLASIANKGRESRSVRRLGIALGLGGIAITTWCVVGGAMFVVEPLDTIARVVLALCVFFALIDLAKRLRGN